MILIEISNVDFLLEFSCVFFEMNHSTDHSTRQNIKMSLSSRFIRLILLFVANANCFQVSNSDLGHSIKRIIETETRQRIINHPITTTPTPLDDTTTEKSRIIQKVMTSVTLSEHCSRPLHQIISTPFPIPPSLNGAVCPGRRKLRLSRWWPFFDDDPEYWFNHRIHSFGNTGLFGGVHATVAPWATKIIDEKAYGGINVRVKVCTNNFSPQGILIITENNILHTLS
jgi:hypothetical protein